MTSKTKTIYILGSEGTGWSIDKDRQYTIEAISNINGYKITNNIFTADIIYAIWWNALLSKKFILFNTFFKKKIIAAITSDLSHQKDKLKKLLNIVDIFVYANNKQKEVLKEFNVKDTNLYFNPFYVDENIFKKLDISKKELSDNFNIDYNDIRDKFLIGSFQRDSLGADLSKPKWQKDPDILIEIMKRLDRNKYILLLAGPRRHYIINQCIKHSINYIFIGDESYIKNMQDDIQINSTDIESMPYLYNLINLYIVSSKSEGGPKAIPEAVLSGTNIISTDVGFAKDLIGKQAIYQNSDEAINTINNIENITFTNKIKEYYSFERFKSRIENILRVVK